MRACSRSSSPAPASTPPCSRCGPTTVPCCWPSTGSSRARATRTATRCTVADGIAVTEHPDQGEVVWCDDAGVTCRRWNWRQARRTQLREDTTAALFILDALDPLTDQALHAAADDLAARLTRLGPGVRTARRLTAAAPARR
jgi:hypothetical protein